MHTERFFFGILPVAGHIYPAPQSNYPAIKYTWRSGKIFGVPVDLHWSFLLIPFAIAWLSWQPGVGFNERALYWYASVSVLLFGFILLHELGHALAAKNRGVVAERIILFPLGGGAYLPEQPKKLWAEVFVYAAGPLANLLLAALVLPFVVALPDGGLLLTESVNPGGNVVLNPTLPQQLLVMTVLVNVLLALGNLLPAYPLDGGRILRALLRRPVGARRATIIVTGLGVVIGAALVLVGWLIGDPLLVVGALFIIGMSALEYRNGWQRRRLAGLGLERVLREPEADRQNRLYASSPVGEARRAFTTMGWPVLPVFDEWNDLRGFLGATHLENEAQQEFEAIHRYYEPAFTSASRAEDLLTVTERIVAANVYGAAVYGDRGRLIGYVFTEDVMTVLRPWWRWWQH